MVLAVVVFGATACGDDSTSTGSAGTGTTVVDQGMAPKVIRLPAANPASGGGAAVSESSAADGFSSRMAWQVYEFEGELPATPASAPAWVFPADVEPNEAAIVALAQAFGVEGEIAPLPADQGGGWVVGSSDFTGASLRVSATSMLDWYFSPAPTDVRPIEMAACEPTAPTADPAVVDPAVDSAVDPAVSVAPESVPGTDGCQYVEPEPPAGVPTEDEARAALVAIMNAAGLDPAGYEIEVIADEWGAYANAWMLLGETRSPLSMSIGFGGDAAITWASGFLATPEPAGEYPLVDAATGLARLNDQSIQWYGDVGVAREGDLAATSGVAAEGGSSVAVSEPAAGAGESSVAVSEPAEGAPPMSCPPTDVVIVDPSAAADAAPLPCEPMPSGPITVVLTGVRTDLTMVWDEDGVVWLLPAFTFLGGDGAEFTITAVTDEYLVQPEPIVLPEPGVTEPGVTEPGEAPPDTPVAELSQADADTLVGLTIEEATAAAEERGWEIRVSELDGVPQALTADFRSDRVNVAVAAGMVVAVTVG